MLVENMVICRKLVCDLIVSLRSFVNPMPRHFMPITEISCGPEKDGDIRTLIQDILFLGIKNRKALWAKSGNMIHGGRKVMRTRLFLPLINYRIFQLDL
jgi:hypothetical protein